MDTSLKNKNSSARMFGFFSLTSDMKYDDTDSALRYYKRPSQSDFPLDLNEGFNEHQEKPNCYFNEKINHLLTYIVNNKENPSLASLKAKYFTFRGVLRLIMCSPFEDRNGWTILATKYKDSIYLCRLTQPDDFLHCDNMPVNKQLAYFAMKIKQYCFTDDPSKMPDPSQSVDVCTEFFGVFERMLAGRKFVFAGEIDGIISDNKVNMNSSETLKDLKLTHTVVARQLYDSFFLEKFKQYKTQRIWTQAFLTGVNTIQVASRDSKGKVNNIIHYDTNILPQLSECYWDPRKSFEFLDEFLSLVECKMENIDCPYTVVKFKLNPHTKNITCTEYPGKTELSLLPEWYLNAIKG